MVNFLLWEFNEGGEAKSAHTDMNFILIAIRFLITSSSCSFWLAKINQMNFFQILLSKMFNGKLFKNLNQICVSTNSGLKLREEQIKRFRRKARVLRAPTNYNNVSYHREWLRSIVSEKWSWIYQGITPIRCFSKTKLISSWKKKKKEKRIPS